MAEWFIKDKDINSSANKYIKSDCKCKLFQQIHNKQIKRQKDTKIRKKDMYL